MEILFFFNLWASMQVSKKCWTLGGQKMAFSVLLLDNTCTTMTRMLVCENVILVDIGLVWDGMVRRVGLAHRA